MLAGPTDYANLAVLCTAHHAAHHHGRFGITHDRAAPGHFRFHRPNDTPIPRAPPPPTLSGDITACHTAAITPDTVQPSAHHRLDLHYATMVMLTQPAQHER